MKRKNQTATKKRSKKKVIKTDQSANNNILHEWTEDSVEPVKISTSNGNNGNGFKIPDKMFSVGVADTYKLGEIDDKRETLEAPGSTVVRNLGVYNRRIMIGTPTLGNVRIEWVSHRKSQVIPINWQGGEVIAPFYHHTVDAVGYQIADAQNVIAERAILDNYEWVLYWEDDVLPPFNSLLYLDEHIQKAPTPVICGLYYTKSDPSWPLIFRGRGNGCFLDFKMGDLVWTDGFVTGFTLIHSSILRYFWENSPRYKLPDGRTVSQVFEFPRKAWIDPESNTYFSELGTSDLHMANRIMKENVLSKTGWNDVSKKKYPFLYDTRIYCHQINSYGHVFPQSAKRILGPGIFGLKPDK